MKNNSKLESSVLKVLAVSALLLISETAAAQIVRVAVATNFRQAALALKANFEAAHQARLVFAFGSTGKHYAQIKNGAPFDIFLAADVRRPALLETEKLAVSGTRFTYAFGRLVLWSAQPKYVDAEGRVLVDGEFRHLAIANPKLAPYGAAARETLTSLGLWESLQDRLVRGENIGQAHQYVVSGNAELGLLALSQVRDPGGRIPGSHWPVPQTLHEPIEQQAILLGENPLAGSFLDFLKSGEARSVIESYGYDTHGHQRSGNAN